MKVYETSPSDINESAKRFLLSWRCSSFSLAVAISIISICLLSESSFAYLFIGLIAGLFQAIWLIFKANFQHEGIDMAAIAVFVVSAAFCMYLSTGNYGGLKAEKLANVLYALTGGIATGRVFVRTYEAEIYSKEIFGAKTGRIRRAIEIVGIILAVFIGVKFGLYLKSQDNCLLTRCIMLVLTIMFFGMISKFRTVIPLNHRI